MHLPLNLTRFNTQKLITTIIIVLAIAFFAATLGLLHQSISLIDRYHAQVLHANVEVAQLKGRLNAVLNHPGCQLTVN